MSEKVSTMIRWPSVEFQEHTLGNGLQILLCPNNRLPLVHLTLHYRVGSSCEKQGFSGFAHLFEHMMFQGSENVGKNEHGRYVDEAGGRWNASTSKDRTNYYETIPSHHLELALWLEADRIRSLKVTEDNFENQRQTVIEEKKQSYDNQPYGLAYLRFDELAYANWAYAHPIIGQVEDLEKATLEDAAGFHRTYYGPGNATLVLCGDIDGSAIDQVERYFGSIVDVTRPQTPDLDEPQQMQEKRETIEDPLAVLPAVFMGYHMPPLGSPEYYALSVLAVVLTTGESSRLYQKLVYENNWITSLSAGPNQYKGPELFCIRFQIQSAVDSVTVLDALEQELQRVCETKIKTDEIEKARNQIAHNLISRLSKVSSIGELLARFALFYETAERINRELDRYLSVSEDDILVAAQQTFRAENRTVLLVEPRPS